MLCISPESLLLFPCTLCPPHATQPTPLILLLASHSSTKQKCTPWLKEIYHLSSIFWESTWAQEQLYWIKNRVRFISSRNQMKTTGGMTRICVKSVYQQWRNLLEYLLAFYLLLSFWARKVTAFTLMYVGELGGFFICYRLILSFY